MTFAALTDSGNAKRLVAELRSDDHRNRVSKCTTKALSHRDDRPTVGSLRENGSPDESVRLGGKGRTVPWESWRRQPGPLVH